MFNLLLVLFAFGCITTTAIADDSKPLEIPDFSKVNAPVKNDRQVKMEMTCKNSEGRTLKQGEAGYESCVNAAQADLSQRREGPNASGNANSTSFNMQFGK